MTTGCLMGDICLLLFVVGGWKLWKEILIGIKGEQAKSYCRKKLDDGRRK